MVLSPVSGNITSPVVYMLFTHALLMLVVYMAPGLVLAHNECGCHGSFVLFLCVVYC